MPANTVVVEGKKAAKLGKYLFLLMRSKNNGEWLAIDDDGEIVARENYHQKDLNTINIPYLGGKISGLDLMREWAQAMVEEERKNVRFGSNPGNRAG
jgi:hypothetical protein